MITGNAMREAREQGIQLDYSNAEIFSNITSSQRLEIVDELRKNGETVATVGYDGDDYELINRCDLGITSLQKTTGSIYEASGLVTSEDNFLQIVDIAKEARQLHRNLKKSISFCISAMIALLAVVLFGGLLTSATLNAAFAGAFAVWVIPVCAMCYLGCTTEMKRPMSPSDFIGRGKMNKSFLTKAITDGVLIGAAALIISAIYSPLMTSAQVLATLFVTLVFGFGSLALSNVSGKIGIIDVIKHEAMNTDAVKLIVITAAASITITYIPFLNTAFGFEMPHPLALIVAVLTGLIPGAVKEIMKKLA
ncbi:MAG: hypothetical protein IKT78_05160, partial [Ruminiclostridium sp.]|nr:hypothetical protein [Ruminiclostridium sp.]